MRNSSLCRRRWIRFLSRQRPPPPHPDVLAGLAIPFPLAACVLRSCSRFFPAALCTGRCASERGFFLYFQEVIKRILYVDKPNKDLKSELLGSNDAPVGEEAKKLTQLVDLLDKALILDPARRLTVQQALAHPFLK